MPRKKRDDIPIEYHLRNCHRCANLIKTKLLTGGKHLGHVRYHCKIDNADVVPHKIDGCKKYVYGDPEIIFRDRPIEKKSE